MFRLTRSNMFKTLAMLILLMISIDLNADYKTGKKIFKQKCSSCHLVNMLAFFLTRSPEHIGDRSDTEMQKIEVADFMTDYLYHPNRKDSIIENKFLKFFTTKKSMKGIVSEKEIDNIADFLVDYKKRRVVTYKKSILKHMNTKQLIQTAKRENKILIVEAMSKTCYYCKKMDKEVLSLPIVKNAIFKNFIYIKVDIDKTNQMENLNTCILELGLKMISC